MSRYGSYRFPRTAFVSVALIALVAIAIGGCGVKGPLKLPPPATTPPPAATTGAQPAPAAAPDLPQDERKP
jgi:predicted small lipoprotein YifL